MADVRPIGAVRGADKCIEVDWALDASGAYASGKLHGVFTFIRS